MCKISIIIPVYNVEKYLRECLDSVFAQEFQEYEVICVNDASTDSSSDILDEYASTHPNIRIITHEQNRGLSATRNTGLRNAKGKYIWFVDSDDMIADDISVLQDLYDYIEEKNVQIVYFNMNVKYEYQEKKWRQYNKNYNDYLEIYDGKELFAHFINDKTNKCEAWRKIFRRDFLIKNKIYFYEGILHEDELFSFRCAMNATRVANLNREYYVYRRCDGSLTSHIKNENIESCIIVIEEIFNWWKNNELRLSLEINEAIGKYLKMLISSIKYNLNTSKKYEKAKVGSYAQKTLFDLIARNDLYGYVSLDMMEHIRKYDKVVVYGAGICGLDITSQLMNAGIYPYAIAVTNEEGNPQNLRGIPVRNVSALLDYKDTACVVIAVTDKYKEQVKEKLKELGFKNIIQALEGQE